MYTDADLRRDTAQQVYQRGRSLFQGGNVQNIQLQDIYMQSTPCRKIRAYVQGSGWQCYNTEIIVNEKAARLHSYHCECPAYREYTGLCKHCVATLLRYIQVCDDMQRKQQQPVKKLTVEFPEKIENPRQLELIDLKGAGMLHTAKKSSHAKQSALPQTDRRLYNILMEDGIEQQLPYKQPQVRGKVRLYPICFDCHGKLSVEFKIGIKQLYVLKDLNEFTQLMQMKGYKSYGAKLGFYHHMSAFAPESAPLASFLVDIMRDFEQRGGQAGYRAYRSCDMKREIPLMGAQLDAFMDIMERTKQPLELETMLTDAYTYTVADDVVELPLSITGVPAGAKLRTAYFPMTEGAAYEYLYDHEHRLIHRESLANLRRIRAFRRYMNERRGDTAFIAERELPLFCRDMLPELEKYYKVELREFHPERYLPEPVRFAVYLDMPQPEMFTCRLSAIYEEESFDVFSVENDAARFIEPPTEGSIRKRDIHREMEMDAAVSVFFPEFDARSRLRVLQGDLDKLYDFVREGIHRLEELAEVYISDTMKRAQLMTVPTFSMGISLKSGLLELTLDAGDYSLEELTEILMHYNRKKKYYRLKSGAFVDMQESQLENLIELVDGLQLNARQLKGGVIELPRYRALYLDSLSHEEGAEYMHKDKDFRQLIRSMHAIEDCDFDVPAELEDIMREYQKSGYRWLKMLHTNGFGGILADDMGLGKTLQVIAFLLTERKKTLIVCPASLVYNWQSEIQRFAPSLQPVMVTGDALHRKELVDNSLDTDILITSYDLLKRDILNYEQQHFFCEILDEAQFIKNQSTQAARAVKRISAGTRFALTGTPMENRLSELWSIFDYLMPGFLFSYKQFKEEVESPIIEEHDEEAMLRLRRMITPFILRRLKKDVLLDLPDKLEEPVYASMEEEQRKLYAANAQNLKRLLGGQSDAQFKEKKLQLLAELTKLRQICCNPALVYENYKGGAAKLEMCMELLHNAISGGHKVLVFSQFTSMLDILAKRARKEDITYYMLTGQTPKEQRMRMVESFNQEDDVSVFFISLKAGGTGLNLTGADIVIHYDPWWNLAAQNQATDRTHRIGQKNVVTVYKLIAKNTIEERILELQELKQELADQVLGGENMDNPSLSREDLLGLLS